MKAGLICKFLTEVRVSVLRVVGEKGCTCATRSCMLQEGDRWRGDVEVSLIEVHESGGEKRS